MALANPTHETIQGNGDMEGNRAGSTHAHLCSGVSRACHLVYAFFEHGVRLGHGEGKDPKPNKKLQQGSRNKKRYNL